MNAGQAREFAAAARANGVFAMEAMWTRFVPVQVALFEYINSGVLGKAIHVMADYSEFSDPIKKPRLFAPEFGGGAIMDLGIYPLSFAARVLGIPNRVQNIAHLSGGVDISDSIALGFAGDRAALIHTSIAVAGFTNATIHLEGGRIQLGSPLYGETNFVAYNHKDEVVHQYQPVSVFGSGRAYQGLEVERCINAGLKESPIMSLDESVAILGVVDAIRQAAGVVFPGD
jgi:predicted dehydrogenase